MTSCAVATMPVVAEVVDLDTSYLYENNETPITFSDMLCRGQRYLEDSPREFNQLTFAMGCDARCPSRAFVKTVFDRASNLSIPDGLQIIFDKYLYGIEFES